VVTSAGDENQGITQLSVRSLTSTALIATALVGPTARTCSGDAMSGQIVTVAGRMPRRSVSRGEHQPDLSDHIEERQTALFSPE